MTGELVAHEFPNGQAVYYRDTDHAYFRDAHPNGSGKGRLTGVSTVTKPFDFDPSALMRWAARSNGEGVAILAADALQSEDVEAMRSGLAWLGSADRIWGALTDSELTYEHLRDQAATRGTNVHKHALHALATGAPVPDFDALSEDERGYARGVMAFWHEREPVALGCEQVVADLDLGVAGRYDLRAVLQAGDVRGEVLVDAKTSGFVSNAAHVQLAGYEHCSVACGLGATVAQLILQVDAEGGYRLVPVVATGEDFRLAVRVYRRAGQIRAATRKHKRETA